MRKESSRERMTLSCGQKIALFVCRCFGFGLVCLSISFSIGGTAANASTSESFSVMAAEEISGDDFWDSVSNSATVEDLEILRPYMDAENLNTAIEMCENDGVMDVSQVLMCYCGLQPEFLDTLYDYF